MRKGPKRSQSEASFAAKPSAERREIYQGENIALVGGSASALQSLNPSTDVLANGISLAAAIRFNTIIHMPIDEYNSFETKMSELYAEMRESNAGAANYTWLHVGWYVLALLNIRGIAHEIMRAFKAYQAKMPNSADSPFILTAVSGIGNYSACAGTLANDFNEFAVLLKDIDNLPCPPMPIFDRQEVLYGRLYADSAREKPALLSFFADAYFDVALDDPNYPTTFVFTMKGVNAGGNTLANWTANLRTLYDAIATDDKLTILRGDMRRAFGAQAYSKLLTPYLTKPLEVQYLQGELRTQVENMNICYPGPSHGADVTMTKSGTWSIDMPYNLDGKIDICGERQEQLINYHNSKPTAEELLQITRLKPVFEWLNPGAANKSIHITANSGDLVYRPEVLTAVTRSSLSTFELANAIGHAQNAALQSDMKTGFINLGYVTSVIDVFPMIVTGDRKSVV